METPIGRVTHYFNRLCVAVLALDGDLTVNNIVHFLGHNTDFYQKAWSMEINHQPVQSVGPGMEVALKVAEPVRKGDEIFRVQVTDPGEQEDILQQMRAWEGNTF